MKFSNDLVRPDSIHVIVGAGAAGLTLCLTLLQRSNCHVILIEQGQSALKGDDKSLFLDPLNWAGAAFTESSLNTQTLTTEQKNLCGRRIMYPQGRGIGGTTNINAMIWTAGHRAIFDKQWPDQWSSVNINRYNSVVLKQLSS